MKYKLTDWYEGTQTPLRAGIYERKGVTRNFYSYWTGIGWLYVDIKRFEPIFVYTTQSPLSWRGITK